MTGLLLDSMRGLPFYVLVFFIGASIGSFLNVCIARWPADESVIRPPSRCPHCGTPIRWYDNVPVVSWLILRARCRACRGPISSVYPLVEAAIGIVFVAGAWAFDSPLAALRVAVFTTIMFGIAVTDARHYVIPDGFTVTGLLFVLGASFLGFTLGDQLPFAGPLDALLGACVGAGAITIIGWLGEVVLKKPAMGYGDSTLMAVVGAALGPVRSLLTILLGALVGSLVFGLVVVPVGWLRSRARGETFSVPEVPFGVFLAPAAVLSLLWGFPLISWYLDRVTG